jgi:hypothetical protein
MIMKTKSLGFILGILAVLVLALFFANFHVSTSSANSGSTVASSNLNQSDGMTVLTTRVYVEPNGRLSNALRAEFARLAHTDNRIQLVDRPDEQPGQPLMHVRVKEQAVRWYAVTASAQAQVEVGYASNGDIYFMGQDPTQFVSETGGAEIQYHGNYSLEDRSTGLISLPGYHTLLARALAEQILASYTQTLAQ